MKKQNILLAGICLLNLFVPLAKLQAQSNTKSQTIFNELAQKDSLLFKAIFDCDLNKIDKILSKDFMFYQDKGYFGETSSESFTDFKTSLQKNFCDKGIKLKRQIVKGSLQVIHVNEEKTLQNGVQRFYMQDKLVEESKFSRVWQKQKGEWKMTQELDFLVNTKFASRTEGNTLYNEIAHMDSVLFNAFNNRDSVTIKNIFDESLEFYHDKGGLTNYAQNIESFKIIFGNNNGLHRELVEGSMEVYPVKDYGAMQVAAHTFCHKENGQDDCGTFKFLHIWQKKNGVWKITRVASYDH
ncbi:nuclear transport factor 2 family protein [Emticicia sp. BO119]|uniref:nuclear transport factor 2 family protein n=1 Tax=Emticicia sp. BO119 TaxID=2757768 RepID=UPI0015F0C8F5|nr:nuclear transport factor 2 family protein [Emticicia sp. BO119]MBA4852312.1 nuclear transport factor 2 family protein [Emticicia sp. BO119]